MIIHLLFVAMPLAGAADRCSVVHAWMARAVDGFEETIPPRIEPEGLPFGPDSGGFHVEGGAAPGPVPAVEFVVVAGDSADAGALRSAWVQWVEGCVAESGGWEGEEIDLEAEIRAPASKALGQFPREAYIREERTSTGLRYRHPGSGAGLEVLTDPTAISSRSVATGYEGPPIVLIVRIEAGQ